MRWRTTGVVVAAVTIAVCVSIGLTTIVSPRATLGLPSAGDVTEWGLALVKSVFDLSAALTIGWLVAAVFLVPPRRDGVLDVGGYRAVRAASLCAMVWTAAALALVPLTVSDAAGKPLSTSLSADQITFGLQALENVRAPAWAALAAVLVAILARVVLRPGGAALVLAPALLGLIPIAVSGHAAQSGDHDLASDSMIYHLVGISIWVGGLVAVLGLLRQRVEHLGVIVRRYSLLALVSFIAVGLSGLLNAWVRFSAFSDVFGTDYGRLVVIKTLLIVLLGAAGYWHRRRTIPRLVAGSRSAIVRLATVEIAVMAATVGVAVALGRTASPPPSGAVPDNLTETLGYSLPGPPAFWNLVSAWRFDLILGTLSLVAVGLYLYGVFRLRRRGIAWATNRTVCWSLGWLTVLVATSSGIGRYGVAQFSIHMISHMALGMIAPILLVLGGPVTLLLRVLPASRAPAAPGMRELVVRAMHSPVTRFVTHPLIVLALFIGSFYAVYFTGIFAFLMAGHFGHLVMEVHFLGVGYLYYWVIIGVDSSPRRLPYMAKLGLLLAALPFHAFFGLAMMNNRTSVDPDYYRDLALPWVGDLISDQRLGGAIAWGATEIPIIIVVIALMSQWAAGDAREARRSDKLGDSKADEDLDAYNAMLAELAFREVDARQGPRRSGPSGHARQSGPSGTSGRASPSGSSGSSGATQPSGTHPDTDQ
ncbi:cytochrome c oxidase assembly protein [Nakamurella sp. A5-74]|uniref:Cytochrome c oxidase assembly protein n=1 Tax=Nakamurella sp. A5-74 TaxID=3158264 RepID=A0AAU8DT47_9ACTN